jgi:hypothetical protein
MNIATPTKSNTEFRKLVCGRTLRPVLKEAEVFRQPLKHQASLQQMGF